MVITMDKNHDSSKTCSIIELFLVLTIKIMTSRLKLAMDFCSISTMEDSM